MLQQRPWRLLFDRSQMLLVIGVLAVVFVAGSFINLAVAKSAALARQEAVRVKLEWAQQQRTDVQDRLRVAQQDQNTLGKAHDYFNAVPAGVTVVMPAPEPAAEETVIQPERSTSQPYWGEWWKRLAQP